MVYQRINSRRNKIMDAYLTNVLEQPSELKKSGHICWGKEERRQNRLPAYLREQTISC